MLHYMSISFKILIFFSEHKTLDQSKITLTWHKHNDLTDKNLKARKKALGVCSTCPGTRLFHVSLL